MKNMRLPGKISNKQQAESQLWLDTLTKRKKNHSTEIRIPNALRTMMSTLKFITDKRKIPQWQEGLGCNLFQQQSHQKLKASFLVTPLVSEEKMLGCRASCTSTLLVQQLRKDVQISVISQSYIFFP